MNGALTAPNLSQRLPLLYRLALVGWVLLALLCITPFWVDLVADYFETIVPCAGVPGVFDDCNAASLTSAEVSVWSSWGLSLQTYAVIGLSGAVFTFLVYTTVAVLLLWQQRQSWLGLTISLALIVIPYTMFAGSRDFAALNPDLTWPATIASFVGNAIMLLFLYLVPNGRFSPRWAYIPLLATFLLLTVGLEYPIIGRISVTGPIRTLISAALFAPLRTRLQTFIDRRFYRQKYDAQQVLANFAQTARDKIETEALQVEILGVVQETVQPQTVSIWLKQKLNR